MINIDTLNIERPPSLCQRSQLKQCEEQGWRKLVVNIVRPPRTIYNEYDLGTQTFSLNKVRYSRQDLSVQHKQKKLSVSLFEPVQKNNWVILYLHGNSSSKMEAMGIIRLIPFKFSLAAFDFLGCGLNEETDSISLGYRQAEQVGSVVKVLEGKGFNVVLWGRSMGAATALRYGKAKVIVADSSFQSFRSLCKQVAKKHSPKYIPNCLISCFFPCVFSKLRNDVKELGDYDIECLDILASVRNINQQTFLIFMSGDEDLLIDKKNSQNLHNNFDGPKKHLQIFKGSHNGRRSDVLVRKIMKMIQLHVQDMSIEMQPLTKTKIEIHLDQ